MRILIIKTSSLGDVIHALPVIDYLHQVSPGIKIDWVVEEPFLPVLEHNPGLNRIFVIKTRKWRKSPFALETRQDLKALRKALRQNRYDLVFDIQGNLKSGLIAWLSNTDHRIGFSRDVLQEKVNCLFTKRQVPFRAIDQNVTDRYLRVISVPFDRDYTDLALSSQIVSSPEDDAAAEIFMAELPPGPVIFFQVGTTWSTKLWHPEGWSELARRIIRQFPDASILINWGSPQEKALAEQIVQEVGSAVRLLPWLRIKELIPVIKRMSLVIGGDTGPVYLAAAVGTPTVSYYRATSSATYAPRGNQHRTIQAAMECTACYRTSCDRDAECRASISVDNLFAAVVDLIKNIHPERK